ncbi:MAG: HDOD domain-containing protein [Deltaproteobacteria bacterium]|nr:HDOD domain-containing protein [Deltaproteobacteria bacterium]
MYPKLSVNLGNLVLSLSDALDLAFPSLAMHQQRVAFIAWELGRRAGLEQKRIEHIFLAGLLHDIGALSIEDKKSLHDNEVSEVTPHCKRKGDGSVFWCLVYRTVPSIYPECGSAASV